MARNNQNQAARERGCSASFPMIPLIVIILAQVGTSSDNAALGIAVQELVGALGATVADVQMANLAYSLVAGSCMIAGGMIGVVVEEIDNDRAQGRVYVNGLDWSARSEEGEILEKGEKVLIKAIEGVKVLVERI